MMKETNTFVGSVWRDLFSLGFYKRSQGRIARQATAAVLIIVMALAGWTLRNYLIGKELPLTGLLLIEAGEAPSAERLAQVDSRRALYESVNGYGRQLLPLAVALGGIWLAIRAVNVPRVADFLIAVEAEMNKVSWPSRTEMFRSTIVVILTIFGLAFVLFGYDLLWQGLLTMLGVLG